MRGERLEGSKLRILIVRVKGVGRFNVLSLTENFQNIQNFKCIYLNKYRMDHCISGCSMPDGHVKLKVSPRISLTAWTKWSSSAVTTASLDCQ